MSQVPVTLACLAKVNTASFTWLKTHNKGGLVALKLQSRNSEKETNTTFAEAIQVKALQHANILALHDAFLLFQPHLRVGLVLEYCAEGDLGSYLRRMKSGSVPSSQKVFACSLPSLCPLSFALVIACFEISPLCLFLGPSEVSDGVCERLGVHVVSWRDPSRH